MRFKAPFSSLIVSESIVRYPMKREQHPEFADPANRGLE
jgi:hypothetical protein